MDRENYTPTNETRFDAFDEVDGMVRVPYDKLGIGRAKKVYKALLTQISTNAPVAVILENTLGSVPVFTRVEAGVYAITSTGAFGDKTALSIQRGNDTDTKTIGYTSQIARADETSNDVIDLLTNAISGNAPSDGALNNTLITIEVYE
jgi:hypothetical protein